MKNLSLLLPGVLAIVVSAAAVLPVVAQNAPDVRPRTERVNKLNLSEAQKAEMKRIREATRAEISAILTPEQRSQFEAAQQARQNRQYGQNGQTRQKPRDLMRSLNLTTEQKAQMKAIHDRARQKMEAVLTPEQRVQMQQRREQMGQRRRQMRQNRPMRPDGQLTAPQVNPNQSEL